MRTMICLFGLWLVAAQAVQAQNTGEATYKSICIHCHGPKGDGKGHEGLKVTPADLRSDEVQKKSDDELYRGVAFGVGHKQYAHAFAERGMSTQQVMDVVAYIRGFAKKSEQSK